MRRSQRTKPKTAFLPTVEPCDPRQLLSALPMAAAAMADSHPILFPAPEQARKLPAVVHTEGARNAVHELDQLPLTGSTIKGTLKGKLESDGKKYVLTFSVGHFIETGQTQINSERPVSGSLEYTVSKDGTYALKKAEITILNLGRSGGDLTLKLTVPKTAKAENAKNVSQFDYSVSEATKFFKGTKAQDNKLITFAQLWPASEGISSSFSGTFS